MLNQLHNILTHQVNEGEKFPAAPIGLVCRHLYGLVVAQHGQVGEEDGSPQHLAGDKRHSGSVHRRSAPLNGPHTPPLLPLALCIVYVTSYFTTSLIWSLGNGIDGRGERRHMANTKHHTPAQRRERDTGEGAVAIETVLMLYESAHPQNTFRCALLLAHPYWPLCGADYCCVNCHC